MHSSVSQDSRSCSAGRLPPVLNRMHPPTALGIGLPAKARRRGVVHGALSSDIVNGMSALIVAAAIFARSPQGLRVLAAQRSYPQELAGLWEFPGGKVEPGEDPESALHRELREELGIEVSVAPDVGVVAGPDGDWPLPGERRMRLWAAYAKGEPRLGPSHTALRWLGESDLKSVPWLKGDLQILSPLARLMRSLGRP